MNVTRCAMLVGALGVAVTTGVIVAWLSIPDFLGIAAVLLALLIAAVAWLVLLVRTLRGMTRRRWIAAALLPAAFALLVPPALLWHRTTGPWIEFLLRRQTIVRLAELSARPDGTPIRASDLAAAGARVVEVRPGYVALQHRNSGWFSNYGFVHVSEPRGAPRVGVRYFGEPVTAFLPLRDGWYFFETASLALAD
jgi:hypothetical protein